MIRARMRRGCRQRRISQVLLENEGAGSGCLSCLRIEAIVLGKRRDRIEKRRDVVWRDRGGDIS